MRLLTDTHAHTLVSGHAYSTMKEMAKAASKVGLEALEIIESTGFPLELIASRDLEHLRPYLNLR